VITAFHGPPERVGGLGLLPYSNCVHYDEASAATTSATIALGMPGGYACDNGAALHFVGRICDVVSVAAEVTAYRVEPIDGVVVRPSLKRRTSAPRRRR
jgi:hypothetical protein